MRRKAEILARIHKYWRALLWLACIPISISFTLVGCNGKSRNLLLITVDTLRADRLGCYGYAKAETPNIDELSREGVMFENVRAAAPLTLPSHSTMMTGQYPLTNGMRNNLFDKLQENSPTLAKILKAQGWRTGAVIGAYVLHSKFGLAQGFDYYEDQIITDDISRTSGYPERSAESVADLGIEWLKINAPKGRFFLWLHFYDPHAPYIPPEPYRSKFAASTYDGEVAYVDSQLGRVFEEMKRIGIDKQTAIILVGDHGEGLGEHGERFHGLLTYDSTLKVPLVVRAKGWPRGAKIGQAAGLVDLLPTALGILKVAKPQVIQGDDLGTQVTKWAQTTRREGPHLQDIEKSRIFYFESRYAYEEFGWSPLEGIIAGNFKYTRAPVPELFDIEADPKEMHNLAALKPELVAKLDHRLTALIGSLTPPGGPPTSRADISAADIQKLRALGYFGASPEPANAKPPPNLPDPKDRIDIAEAIERAQFMLGRERPEVIIKSLENLKSRDPKNSRLFLILAQASEKAGKNEIAEEYYRQVLALKPRDAFALSDLGLLLLKKGKIEEGEAVFRAYGGFYPFDTANLEHEAQLLAARKKFGEAVAKYREFLKKEPQDPEGHYELGLALEAMSDPTGAISEYHAALYYSRKFDECQFALGRSLLKVKRFSEAMPILESLGVPKEEIEEMKRHFEESGGKR